MPKQKVEYIGHNEEIQLILSSILEWNTCYCLFINGIGGVGKTSLIEEVTERLEEKFKQSANKDIAHQYRIFKFDLDDNRLQSSEEISLDIIQTIGVDDFRQYIEELRTLHQLEQMHSEKATEQRNKVTDTFIKTYIHRSTSIRTVIFCDTTEIVNRGIAEDALKFLLVLSHKLENAISIFSGQNTDALYREFTKIASSTNAKTLSIEPLSLQDSLKYLKQKEELLHIVIDSDVEQKLVLLSRGIPFLIDLAAEWIARDFPLKWLTKESLKQIQALSKTELEAKQEELEVQLVQYIGQLRHPLDRLTLALAWVHPIDYHLCAKLLDLTEEQSKKLIRAAQESTPFVKILPNGWIKLHDYMEKLVFDNVWTGLEDDQKRRESQRAGEYFEHVLQKLSEERGKVINDANGIYSESTDLRVFLQQEKMEREYWQIAYQLLYHALFVDANKGSDTFCKLFDEAYKLQQVSFIDKAVNLMQNYSAQLLWNQLFELRIRSVEVLLDQSNYSEAEKLMTEMLRREEITVVQKVHALIKRGNARIRVYNKEPLQRGLDDFSAAIELAQENSLPNELGLAELEVGWVYSNIGDWGKANKHFKKALDLALENKDQELEAKALNEIAYISFFYDRDTAISRCNDSIKIWLELKDEAGLGRSYSNMGTIYYRAGDYQKAQDYFQRALDIFDSVNNQEWIGIVSSWQGITLCSQAMLGDDENSARALLHDAENLVMRAVNIGVHQDGARNANRLARIYRVQGEADKAWNQLLVAYKASRNIPDVIYEAASIRDLSSMALEFERFDFYENLKKMLSDYRERGVFEFSLAFGGALVNVGILALHLGDNEYGTRSIANGLKFSAESGKYATHTFAKTLETFSEYVQKLVPPSETQELAKYLRRYWENEDLGQTYIEATRAFYKL